MPDFEIIISRKASVRRRTRVALSNENLCAWIALTAPDRNTAIDAVICRAGGRQQNIHRAIREGHLHVLAVELPDRAPVADWPCEDQRGFTSIIVPHSVLPGCRDVVGYAINEHWRWRDQGITVPAPDAAEIERRHGVWVGA